MCEKAKMIMRKPVCEKSRTDRTGEAICFHGGTKLVKREVCSEIKAQQTVHLNPFSPL